MAIVNINLLGKVPKSTHNPLFSSKIPKILRPKNVPQSYGLGQDPPLLQKNSIINPLFPPDGFPRISTILWKLTEQVSVFQHFS